MAVPAPGSRVFDLTWSWDCLANQTEWTDDRSAFYERSLGRIDNGDDLSDALRPSAIYLATNLDEGTGPNAGWVEVDYGRGGNMTAMTVHAQCTDGPAACVDLGGDLTTRRASLRANCECAVEQHYVYRWDELNRLAEARRYGRDGTAGTRGQLETRQRYRYDGANARVLEQTLDQSGCGGSCERVALYPYPGDFERRGLVATPRGYEADRAVAGSETQYVIAGAHAA